MMTPGRAYSHPAMKDCVILCVYCMGDFIGNYAVSIRPFLKTGGSLGFTEWVTIKFEDIDKWKEWTPDERQDSV